MPPTVTVTVSMEVLPVAVLIINCPHWVVEPLYKDCCDTAQLGRLCPFAEVMTVRAGRMALVRGIVDGLTSTELERICTRAPAPGYPEESRSVGDCLAVVIEEECEHHRFAVRDLAALKVS